MANEDKKDFNAMMNEDKGMPKMQIITDEAVIKRYGGTKMYFAPPLDYDALMKRIPYVRSSPLVRSETIWQNKMVGILLNQLLPEPLSQLLPGLASSGRPT